MAKNLADMTPTEAHELTVKMADAISPLLPQDARFILILNTAQGDVHFTGDGHEDYLPNFLRACAKLLEEDKRTRRAARDN